MSLNFPNSARSYDQRKQCVSFWAHDNTLEIAFDVEGNALQAICPNTTLTEEALLTAFDNNRSRIEKAAAKTYAKRRMPYLRLTSKDF